jgi:hypothetical protein
MARQRVEIIDGKEFTVTLLPQDGRLKPSQARKRALWAALTPHQKAAEIAKRKRNAKRRRRQRKTI